MVCGWILSFPLLRSCLVDVPALLQEQNGRQSIDLAKRGHAALPGLGIVTNYNRQQSQQQGKPEGLLGMETV